MAFNPNDYIIKLQGKDYLQVTHRVMWYRETYPAGAITTDLIATEPQPIVKAYVTNNEGVVIATGFGSAKVKERAVWTGREIEKAETAAIGRALALAGFGTQFANEYDDSDNLSDSPQQGKKQPESKPTGSTGGGVPESMGKLSERGNGKPAPINGDALWFQNENEQRRVQNATKLMPGAAAKKFGKVPMDYTSADELIAEWEAGS